MLDEVLEAILFEWTGSCQSAPLKLLLTLQVDTPQEGIKGTARIIFGLTPRNASHFQEN